MKPPEFDACTHKNGNEGFAVVTDDPFGAIVVFYMRNDDPTQLLWTFYDTLDGAKGDWIFELDEGSLEGED